MCVVIVQTWYTKIPNQYQYQYQYKCEWRSKQRQYGVEYSDFEVKVYWCLLKYRTRPYGDWSFYSRTHLMVRCPRMLGRQLTWLAGWERFTTLIKPLSLEVLFPLSVQSAVHVYIPYMYICIDNTLYTFHPTPYTIRAKQIGFSPTSHNIINVTGLRDMLTVEKTLFDFQKTL